MPYISRKRRTQASPSPTSPPPATRRRHSPSEAALSDTSTSALEADADADADTQALTTQSQTIKNIIRLALSSEYSRTPLRRSDITSKCLPPNSGRQFQRILAGANDQLRSVFGMELTPLPLKEKATVAQKRAAQRQAKETQSHTQTQSGAPGGSNAGGSNGNNASYILTTTLPPRYRLPTILTPSSIPTPSHEASYTGFVTFILSLIYLTPGQVLPEAQLEKHLRRMNSEDYVPVLQSGGSGGGGGGQGGQPTETVLKRMVREGYIVKVKERDETVGGEERVEWIVGPRGRVEVGEKAVAGVVRGVFRKRDGEGEELERRLVRSLGMGVEKKAKRVIEGEGGREGEGGEGEGERRRENGDSDNDGDRNGNGEEEAQQTTRSTRSTRRSQSTYSGTARGGRGAATHGRGTGRGSGRGRGRPRGATQRQEAEIEDEDENDEEEEGEEEGEEGEEEDEEDDEDDE